MSQDIKEASEANNQNIDTDITDEPTETIYKPNTQSKKWLLVINNPDKHGYTHDKIKELIVLNFKTILYFCMSDEVSKTGTPHTHIFFQTSSAIRFQTLTRHFPNCFVQMARANAIDNKSYVGKTGDKWKEKSSTRVEGSFEEWGDIEKCKSHQGQRTDLIELLNAIKSGASDTEILSEFPNQYINLKRLEDVRQAFLKEKYENQLTRELHTEYWFGPPGVGKTQKLIKMFGSSVYRVTNYKNSFDGYNGNLHTVIAFEDYNSSLYISDMLQYLDFYNCFLPSRYQDKMATYSTAIIISNLDLREQYKTVQETNRAIWKAFLRRIHKVVRFNDDGTTIEYNSASEYMDKTDLNKIRCGENGATFLTINDIKL